MYKDGQNEAIRETLLAMCYTCPERGFTRLVHRADSTAMTPFGLGETGLLVHR